MHTVFLKKQGVFWKKNIVNFGKILTIFHSQTNQVSLQHRGKKRGKQMLKNRATSETHRSAARWTALVRQRGAVEGAWELPRNFRNLLMKGETLQKNFQKAWTPYISSFEKSPTVPHVKGNPQIIIVTKTAHLQPQKYPKNVHLIKKIRKPVLKREKNVVWPGFKTPAMTSPSKIKNETFVVEICFGFMNQQTVGNLRMELHRLKKLESWEVKLADISCKISGEIFQVKVSLECCPSSLWGQISQERGHFAGAGKPADSTVLQASLPTFC